MIVWDCLAWLLALGIFTLVRYDFRLTAHQWAWTAGYCAAAVLMQIVLGLWSQIYLGRSRVGSFSEATWIGGLVLLVGLPLGLILTLVAPDFPRGVAFMLPPLALVFMAAGRWVFRIVNHAGSRTGGDVGRSVPVLLYGAGEAGHQVATLIDTSNESPYRIVGFVDDDPSKRYLRVNGHKVLGTGKDVVRIAREQGAERVILSISDTTPQLIQELSDTCSLHGLKFSVLPSVRERVGGRISLAGLRDFNVADLLGRRQVKTDLSTIADYVCGKVVLVTGAGGSIGSELALQLHKLGPSKLVLLDRDESALHSVQLNIYGVGLLDTDDMVLCDIRDYDALHDVFEYHQPDVVFHAAALKHLPMLEQYPREGWKTNVLGTRNVLRCAKEVGVTHFVNVSTDKAADASSVLGRTKRIAERLTAWHAEQGGLPYVSVRFGNVLGSRGSVLYTFRAQIDRGGPITVTHPDVTRYFMTIPEACELVIQAGAIGQPGAVMVLDMGEPIRIVDVANRLIAESGKDIEIHFTGLRPGEKLHEVLFSGLEKGTPSVHPLISQVKVAGLDPAGISTERPQRDAVLELLGQKQGSEIEKAEELAKA